MYDILKRDSSGFFEFLIFLFVSLKFVLPYRKHSKKSDMYKRCLHMYIIHIMIKIKIEKIFYFSLGANSPITRILCLSVPIG